MQPPGSPSAWKLSILIPVYDDWVSLERLLASLHTVMAGQPWSYEIVVVDDASPTAPPAAGPCAPRPANCRGVLSLRLCKNLGHQRAIAAGLVFIQQRRGVAVNAEPAAVAVMDGDGEDAPQDLPRLLDACAASDFSRAVFAWRVRRSESMAFKLGYEAYCVLHRLAVGRIPRVGNFSVVPAHLLPALVVDPNLWNHFAASVFASRLPRATLPIARAHRYAGRSKLGFVGLVVHGLSALACYSEIIGVRALVVAVGLCLAGTGAAVGLVALHFSLAVAVPGWAAAAAAGGLVLGLQALTVSLAFTLLTLSRRHDSAFLPSRDAAVYIREQRRL